MSFPSGRLHVRVILLVSTVLLLAGILSGWFSARRESGRLHNDMRVHASIMTRNFADNCARFLLLNDYAELEAFLARTVDLPDIDLLQVCEPDGLVVGEARKKNNNPSVETPVIRIAPPATIAPSMSMEGWHLTVWHPITAGSLIGWIRADYSMASIEAAQSYIWKQGLLTSTVLVMGCAVLILIMLRPATRSLERLAAFARGLSDNRGDKVSVEHISSEIIELESSLNFASARLHSSEQQLLRDREQLMESEKRYKMVFENSPVSIWEEDFSAVREFLDGLMEEGISDIESYFKSYPEAVRKCAELTRIVDINQAAVTLHGASSKEELLAGLVNTFTDESFETFRQELVSLWNGQTEMSSDAVVKTLSGKRRHVTVYFSVCPGYEKTLSKVLVSVVDISGRKLVEDTLKFIAQLGWADSQESFLTLLSRHLGAVLNVDYVIIDRISEEPGIAETIALYAKGNIVPNMRYALKGTPCENVVGKRLCLYERGVQALFPEDSLLAEMNVESYAGIPLWDQAGICIGLIAVMDSRPIHDRETLAQLLQLAAVSAASYIVREHSEQQLRQRELEFRMLANNIPDMIVRYDRQMHRTFVNRAWEEASGHAADEVVNVNAANIPKLPLPLVAEYVEKIRHVLEHGVPEKAEFSWVNTRGETLVFEYLIVPEYDQEGRIAGVLSVGRDMTERKNMEEELRRLNEELERRVGERTANLESINEELKRMNRLFVGRELKMVELKEKLRELENRSGAQT